MEGSQSAIVYFIIINYLPNLISCSGGLLTYLLLPLTLTACFPGLSSLSGMPSSKTVLNV